jgi:hypothetical protein
VDVPPTDEPGKGVDAPPADAPRKGVAPPPAAASTRGGAAVYYCIGEGVVPSSDAVPGRAVAPPSTASSGMEMQTAPQPWLPNANPPSSMVWGRTGGLSDLFHRAYHTSKAGA